MKNFVFIFWVAHFRNYVFNKINFNFAYFLEGGGFVLHPIFDAPAAEYD